MLEHTLYFSSFLLLIDLLLLFMLESREAAILLFYLLPARAIMFLPGKSFFIAESIITDSFLFVASLFFSGVLDMLQFLLKDLLMIFPALSRFSDTSVSKVLEFMNR